MDLHKLTAAVEKVSQKYSHQFGIKRDSDWFILKLQEELGELSLQKVVAAKWLAWNKE